MRRRSIPPLLAVVLIAAACSSSGGGNSSSPAGNASASSDKAPLKVGLAIAQTGFLGFIDVPWYYGFKTAVDQINASGGVDGHMIDYSVKDTRTDATQTTVVAQEFLDQGVDVLVLPSDQDVAIGGGQLAQQAQVPAFSTAASQPTLTTAVGNYMFGLSNTDNNNSWAEAKWAIENGFKTAYTIGSPDQAYTQTIPVFFKEAFESMGGKVVGTGTFSSDQTDFSSEITKIKALNPQPDIVMTSMFEPAWPAFINQLRAAGVTSQVLGVDGLDSPTVAKLKNAEGVVFPVASFAKPGSDYAKLLDQIAQKYGAENATGYVGYGYDLGQILKEALAKAGTTDPQAMRDAIASLENVPGITGPITYAGTNGIPKRTVYIVQLHNGQKKLVWSGIPDPSEVPQPSS
jgi:branched-chain amino acid transport system substrate-binding protein